MLKEINLVAQVNFTSYGLVALNLIKSLDTLGVHVNLFPVVSAQHIEALPEDHELISHCLINAQLADFAVPSVRLWHQFDLAMYPGHGSKYGWPIFELDRFNEIELHHLASQENIIVCSKWAKTVLENNHIDPDKVFVIPLGVDNSIFHPIYDVKKDNITRFYSIGKWEIRKSHDVIISCFLKSFSADDDVELHMLTANRLLPEKQTKQWEDYYRHPKVKLYPWMNSQRELANVIKSLDCGLFISRAEGWDLGLLESMSMGKPVIATNYSGHTEFCSSANSMLVNIDNTEVANDGIWFHGQGNWAEISEYQEEQIIYYMREIHRRKQGGDTLVNYEGTMTAKKFSWENTARQLLEIVNV